MYFSSFICFIFSFVLFSSVPSVSGHGYIIAPFKARNSHLSHDCPHCANGRGPCGGGGQWTADGTVLDVISKYTSPLTNLKLGQIIEVEVFITAAHWGHFILELCRPSGSKITEECFKTRLQRDPTDSRYSPYISSEPTLAIFQDNTCVTNSNQKVRFVIPEDFEDCEHCIIRWAWQTGNSCCSSPLVSSAEATQSIRDWKSVDGCHVHISSQPSCGVDCPTPLCPNEQFKNCADVSINSHGSPPTQSTTTSTKATQTSTTSSTSTTNKDVSKSTSTTSTRSTSTTSTRSTSTTSTRSTSTTSTRSTSTTSTRSTSTTSTRSTSTTSTRSTSTTSTRSTSSTSTENGGEDRCCVTPLYEHIAGMAEWCRMNGCAPPTHCYKC